MDDSVPIYSLTCAALDQVETGPGALLVPLQASVRIVRLSPLYDRAWAALRHILKEQHEIETTKNPSTAFLRGEMNFREATLRQKFLRQTLTKKLSKMVAATALVAVLSVQAAFGQAAQKTWKDGEYDLANPAMSDQNAQTRLGKLDAWKAKFPATDFEAERKQTYLATYQALNKPAEVFATSKEMLAKDPDNLAALTALVIFIYRFTPPSVPDMATADQAATSLLSNADKYFATDKKPQGVTDDQWLASKKEILGYAQNCLAWTSNQRKDWEKAESEYGKVVQMQPTNVQATYTLATVIVSQKKIDKLPVAIFHLARAANYTGAGALPENNRKSIQTYFEKQYKNYHGDLSDIDKVVAVAIVNSLPPSDFKIKSVVQIQEEKDAANAAAAAADPAKAMWQNIKDQLSADTGQAYFDKDIKGSALPKFKGKLISATPETNPKELVLGIAGDGKIGEVTLKLDAALRGKMDAGTEIGFEGVANAYSKDPFMVTFDVEKAKITGWVASGPAPIQKKGGAPVRPPVKKK